MSFIIYDSQISDLLSELSESHQVFVPVENEPNTFSGRYIFKEYEKGDRLALLYAATANSPKEFLFPPKEVVFSYNNGKASEIKAPPKIIFGLSGVDLEGIDRLTKVFESPVNDQVFLRNKETALIVAVDRFSPPGDLKFDLYLQEIEPGVFAAFAGSKEGKKIISKSYFKKHQIKIPQVLSKKDPLLSDPDLPRAIKESKNHPIWKELTKTCFGCGICSYVCPLCYCFETSDEVDFCEDDKGTRCRNWDSCMLKSFATVAGGNFRKDLEDRIYNWYYHKFVRMPAEYGFSGCVDCNRCTIYCPANINYQKVLRTVLTDYKKRKK